MAIVPQIINIDLTGPTPGGVLPPPPSGVDLIVTDITWTVGGVSKSVPDPDDHVVFTATVQNIGGSAMPAGTVAANAQLAVGFYIDGSLVTWADKDEASLAAGASRTLTANGHPGDAAGADGINYWVATSGTHTVGAIVNEIQSRKAETNYSNNSYSESITVSTGAGGGGGGGGTGDVLVGTAAYRMIGWGSNGFLYKTNANHALQKSRGWGGFGHAGGGFLRAAGMGGSWSFKGTTAANDGLGPPETNPWYVQQLAEGVHPDNNFINEGQVMQNNDLEFMAGFYGFGSDQYPFNGEAPPLGKDWFNTSNRTAIANYLAGVAGFLNLINGDVFSWDFEANGAGLNASGYLGDTHTEAQNRQAAYDFGRALASAMYAVKPDLHTMVYSWYPARGFNDMVQIHVNNKDPNYTYILEDFFCGWMRGMLDQNATGTLILADATFYRFPETTYGSSAVTFDNAYKLNTQGPIAFMSQLATPGNALARPWAAAAARDAMLKYLKIVGFTWLTHDGVGNYYYNTMPTGEDWATMQMQARKWSMGTRRVEYCYEGHPDNNARYSEAAVIAGGQQAASPAPIATALPVISNISATDNGGGVFTISCRASHAFGIRTVEFYSGSTFLATATMVWNQNGGSLTTSFPNDFMQCTGVLSGRAAGQTISIVARSVKDDQKTATVVLPGTPASSPMPDATNTGPRSLSGTITFAAWLAAGTASNKTITGGGAIDSSLAGVTLTANDCVFDSQIFYSEYTVLSPANYPVLNFNYCTLQGGSVFAGPCRLNWDHCLSYGGFWTCCLNCAAEDHIPNQTNRSFPATITNTWFYAFANPNPPPSYHTEALHIVSGNQNMAFTNTRFTHQGGFNWNSTGCSKMTLIDSSLINCFWDWDNGDPASYYSINLEGRNVTITGGRAMAGAAGYYLGDVVSPPGGGGANNYVLPPGLAQIKDWYTGNPIG